MLSQAFGLGQRPSPNVSLRVLPSRSRCDPSDTKYEQKKSNPITVQAVVRALTAVQLRSVAC
jgi:hypothetical protein